jgi:hypothetical protein
MIVVLRWTPAHDLPARIRSKPTNKSSQRQYRLMRRLKEIAKNAAATSCQLVRARSSYVRGGIGGPSWAPARHLKVVHGTLCHYPSHL